MADGAADNRMAYSACLPLVASDRSVADHRPMKNHCPCRRSGVKQTIAAGCLTPPQGLGPLLPLVAAEPGECPHDDPQSLISRRSSLDGIVPRGSGIRLRRFLTPAQLGAGAAIAAIVSCQVVR